VAESKAVFKIAGFWQSQQKKLTQEDAASAARQPTKAGVAAAGVAAAGTGAGMAAGTGPLHALMGFLQALTNADADGRIVVQPPPAQQLPWAAAASGGGGSGTAADGLLKFVLLNAAAHFGRVVSAAHAVVLASGTLSPLESVLHLFPDVPPHRLHRFSCGHVVGKER
jgi:chromosome transmission fidelity protein 1